MNSRVYAQALIAACIVLSSPVKAQDECTKLVIYAINQFCRMLPNGQNLCQPVALTGPSPACEVPAGTQLKPIPLAPPTLQMPQGYPFAYNQAPFTPYTPFPPTAFPGYVPPQFGMPQFAMPQGFMPMAPAAGQTEAATPQSAPTTAETRRPVATDAPPAAESTTSPTTVASAPLPPPVTASPEAATPASPITTDASAPEMITPNLPEAPSLPVVVAEAVALFPFDSAELTPLGKQALDNWLASAPVGMPVVVYGYADRLGPEDYNLELSRRRADAARFYLISKGKDPRDIRAIGKGETDPVKRCKGGPSDATKACLAPNRRVLITNE